MLKVFRKKGVMKKILWFLAVVIILSFGILANMYLLAGSTSSYAGRVFGKKVSMEEFQRNYQQTLIQAMIQYGPNYRRIQQYLNLESETWDRIIVLYEARKRQIRIPDTEVVSAIQKFPFFQRDNQFDKLLYNDILRNVFKISSRDFEEGIRDSLKFKKIYDQETAGLKLSEGAIFEAFKSLHQKAQISYILFDSDKFKPAQSPDETALQAFYEKHKEEFVNPPMIDIEYVIIELPAELMTAENSDDEKAAEDPQKLAAYTKAFEITQNLNNDVDFAEAAKSHGLTVQSSGFFSMEQPNLTAGWSFPLIQSLFGQPLGHVEGPVESPRGYQVLKIKARKEKEIPEFSQAKTKVAESWLNDQAKISARAEADKYYNILRTEFDQQKRPDFAKIAKDNGLDIFQTPVFARGEYLPTIGLSRDFQNTAFNLNEDNRLSSVVDIAKGSCILHLDNFQPASKEEFEKNKEEFSVQLLENKKKELLEEFISGLRLKAQLEDRIAQMKTQAQQQQRQ